MSYIGIWICVEYGQDRTHLTYQAVDGGNWGEFVDEILTEPDGGRVGSIETVRLRDEYDNQHKYMVTAPV